MKSRVIRVSARNTVTIRRIMMRQSMAGRIVSGSKILPQPQRDIRIAAGEIFCFERRSEWQIIQQAALGKPYAAELLLISQSDIDAFAAQSPAPRTFAFHTRPDAALAAVWQKLAQTAEPERADVLHLLALLDAQGWRFSQGETLSATEKLERLLAAQLHLPWTQTQAAAALGLSVSTLKRHLHAEHTSFAVLLRQLRMENALFLLMGQPISVGNAAAACGYHSPGRFAAAFKQHFGFLPSELQN
ncbi:helix-turn-helix transcriptional regulator [Neisseria dentiae]|uniref:helix-turn-helix transcriptional regulator n=1 Tax=Neisseria dentiae TaxID=194197 RepID=UPI0035A00E47